MAVSKMELKPLMDSVNCSICMKTLSDTRSLPCMHNFCRECVQEVIDRHRGTFPCPICRDDCPIPDQGAAGLKVNFFANSVLDAMDGLKVEETTTWNCDICNQHGKTIPAVLQCMECNEKFCQNCGLSHKGSRFSKSHLIIELTGDRARDSKAAISLLSQRTLYCQEHKNEQLKYFCKDDQCLICQDCFAFDHQGHELENIGKTAKANKENLGSVIDLGKQWSDTYAKGIKTGLKEREEIEKNFNESEVKLAKERKELRAKVDAHVDEMEAKVDDIGVKAMNNVKACITELESQKQALDDTVLQLETLKQHGHSADIAYMVPEINNKREVWSDSLPQVNIKIQDRIMVEPSQVLNQFVKLGSIRSVGKVTADAEPAITKCKRCGEAMPKQGTTRKCKSSLFVLECLAD